MFFSQLDCWHLHHIVYVKSNCNGTVFVFQPTNQMSMAQAFLRWVQAQGRTPHAPGILKNIMGPVGIPLKRGASGTRQST